MPNLVPPIPKGYHSLTPSLVFRNADRAIDFYKTVFSATELMRTLGPGGKIMHAELKIGDSIIFINDTMSKTPTDPEPGATTLMYLVLYVPDADAVFNRAVAAGARVEMPVQDMFWGDLYGKLTDPFGQQWGIATHKEDVAPEEISHRQEEFFAKAAAQSSEIPGF
jgi:PhnB protein